MDVGYNASIYVAEQIVAVLLQVGNQVLAVSLNLALEMAELLVEAVE